MKWLYTITIGCLLACISCGQANPEKDGDSVIFLFDITDTFNFIREISSEELKPQFNLYRDLNAGAKIKVATIENLRYTEQIEFSVASTKPWQANVLDRMNQRDTFFTKLDYHIRRIKKLAHGRNGSYIAYAVSRALHQLALDTAYPSKKLFVFSDLREYSSELNFYQESTLKTLQQSPEVLFDYLDSLYPLPDLKGVNILLVFRSKNHREDDAFFILSAFWKAYYERKSAKVSIHSELPAL